MFTNNLTKIVKGRSKRVGRGVGSGKGMHTSGRGQKGQRSRSGNHTPKGFVGGQTKINRVLPKLGKLDRKAVVKPVSISISVFLDKGINDINVEAVRSFTDSENFVIVGPKSYEKLNLKKVKIAEGIKVSKSLQTKISGFSGKAE